MLSSGIGLALVGAVKGNILLSRSGKTGHGF